MHDKWQDSYPDYLCVLARIFSPTAIKMVYEARLRGPWLQVGYKGLTSSGHGAENMGPGF